MSVNLESVLKSIQSEKNTKLIANNLRYGVNCMGVQGGLHPVTIEGGDVGRTIYLQNTTPEDPNGIWINTDKTYEDIYIENERYVNGGSIIFSNGETTDPNNVIANHNNNSLTLWGATYAQKGNVIHFFGYYNSSSSSNTTALVHRHWKYDFDTNTWTQLSNCPTPQGGCKAVWVGDYIYIFGTTYNVNTDYNKYAYKYDVINDIWERITDCPFSPGTNASRGMGCAYDGNDTIYLISYTNFYKYTISTDNYTFLAQPSSSVAQAGYNNLIYYNNYIYTAGWVNAGASSYTARYDISTNKWSTYGSVTTNNYSGNGGSGSYSYTSAAVLVNNRLYLFSNNGSNNRYLGSGIATSDYFGWISLDNSSSYKKITTRSDYSTATGFGGVPFAVFTTDRGPVIVFFGGISSGTTTANNNEIGVIVQDKDYSDLENNTLVIYSTDGAMGTYTTTIYRDNKTIDGKIYQRFNDVNFWDVENQQLIKNLTTYYGNGTNWVQIK